MQLAGGESLLRLLLELFVLQGLYRIRNATMDIDAAAQMFGAMEGYVWKVHFSMYDERQKVHMCMQAEGDMLRVRRTS